MKQLTFYNPTNCEAIDLMLQYAAEGKINIRGLITHTFDAEQAPDAYRLLVEKPQEALGMVLKW